jgi:acyl-CoA thioesterase-1
VNAGVSGDTAADGLARFEWSVPENADGLILELGANDALRGLDPAKMETALEAIIKKAEARGLPVLLAGMEAPRNLGPDYVAQFHAVYADLAKRHDVIFYPFFLDGMALDQKLTLDDGMHPNAKGVAVIVKNIMPDVEKLLARVQAEASATKIPPKS